ncbi:hypothetical protein IIG_04889 [Bacillus cereus VD048]|uniref:Uncharacterized protein n=1 Tax=Bacillus cereus VD048 TaxID=1053226 RepID=J8HND7_BACCE|nr:hypothetical protein IIG_04889 [Bacillus cereus VD048]
MKKFIKKNKKKIKKTIKLGKDIINVVGNAIRIFTFFS